MMEPQQSSNEPLFGLQVDYDSGNTFREAGRWANFVSIIFFVCIGIGILVMAFSGAVFTRAMSVYMPELAGMGGLVIGVVIIVLIIFTYITILLYRFANLVRQGIEQQNQAVFNDGIRHLKNYFLINGVFALLGIVMNVVGIIGKLF